MSAPIEPQSRVRMSSGSLSTAAGEREDVPIRNQDTQAPRPTSQTHSPTTQPHATTTSSTSQPAPQTPTLTADHLISTPTPSTLWTPRKETILLSPYTYMHNHPGKDIRTQLISAFNAYLRVPPPALSIITRAIGMLHTSSLLVDDVEDSSLLRRGVPVAHAIFGVPQTLNSANYVYFLALSTVMELGKGEAVGIFAEEMVNLHRGQGMDLWWRDSLMCPSEGEYLEMVSNKTGGLFRLAVKLMLVESQWGKDPSESLRNGGDSNPAQGREKDKERDILIPLVNTIGLLFQILDDYRNLSSGIYTTNKGLAEDLTEGKFSFPIIHAIRSSSSTSPSSSSSATHNTTTPPQTPQQQDANAHDATQSNNVLLNILRQKTTDPQVKQYALRYMEDVTQSFAYTRDVLRQLTRKALGLIDEMDAASTGAAAAGAREEAEPPSRGLRAILEKLDVDESDEDHRKREGRGETRRDKDDGGMLARSGE
ncbi:MAG: geranylgeranyl pyrophosphate synthetase [Chrysothrix sp. TS-e1954]|nr:MAG: geranylgeranyl pyrophosphate synthetase [Chrysothrix sp. TS-e1954]